jgi:hypothetical protein
MALPRLGSTAVLVSWDGSGEFDGAHDDVAGAILMDTTISVEVGRDQARALGRPQTAAAGWQLYNEDRTYSSEYSGSPLRGQLLPGRPAVVQDVLGTSVLADASDVLADDPDVLAAGSESVRMFTGSTDEPKEQYGAAPSDRAVQMTAIGSLAKLRAADPVTLPIQTDITTGAAMALLLAAAGLTEDEYVIDQAVINDGRLMTYWWVDRRDPFSVAIELWATEGATAALYEDQDGRLNFEGSTYLSDTARSQEVQATFVGSPDSEDDLWFTGLEIVPGYQQIVNDISIDLDIRAAAVTPEVVYEEKAAISLSAGETRTIFASVNDPLTAIVTPALTTDYTIGAGALVSVTLTVIGAVSVGITLVAGPAGATVNPPAGGTGLRLRAQPVTVLATQIAVPTVDLTESQATYGKQALDTALAPWRCLDPDDASGVADSWFLAYGDNRPVVNLTLVNATGEHLRQILQRRVSDLIHVDDLLGSGAQLDLTIQQIRHEITGEGRHVAILGCEKSISQDWARWDIDLWDTGRWGQ